MLTQDAEKLRHAEEASLAFIASERNHANEAKEKRLAAEAVALEAAQKADEREAESFAAW